MSNKNNNSRKLFVGPAVTRVAVNAAKQAAADKMGPQFVTNLSKLDRTIEGMSPNYKTQAAAMAIEILRGDPRSPRNMPPVSPGSNKGSTNGNAQKGGALVFPGKNSTANSNTSYALSKAPNPKPISLNSGVRPNTFVNDYMTPVTGSCIPLHMSGGSFKFPTSGTNPMSAYISGTVVFDIQTRAQANVSFALDTAGNFSAANIIAALNAGAYALCVYFFYSSILSYESDPRNKNAGMIYLRSLITPQILSDMTQLGRRLEDTPLPPRLVQLCRYLYGTFLSSDFQGSPLLKLYPHAACTQVDTGSNQCAAALTGLTTATNNSVYVLMRRSIPQWRIGTLFDVPASPLYDKNFISIFANKPNVYYTAGSNVITGTVPDLYTSISYNSYNNKLDGLAFAMTNVQIGSDPTPGLLQTTSVNATNVDNRISYYVSAGSPAFVASQADSFIALSRQESYMNVAGVVYTPHLFGTDKCQSVNGSALVQAAQNSLDFIFDINSIPLTGKLSSFSGKSRGI